MDEQVSVGNEIRNYAQQAQSMSQPDLRRATKRRGLSDEPLGRHRGRGHARQWYALGAPRTCLVVATARKPPRALSSTVLARRRFACRSSASHQVRTSPNGGTATGTWPSLASSSLRRWSLYSLKPRHRVCLYNFMPFAVRACKLQRVHRTPCGQN